MFNCGMMAVELPSKTIDHFFTRFADKETVVETDLKNSRFMVTSGPLSEEVEFSISAFDRALVNSGGWVNYADSKY